MILPLLFPLELLVQVCLAWVACFLATVLLGVTMSHWQPSSQVPAPRSQVEQLQRWNVVDPNPPSLDELGGSKDTDTERADLL